MGMRAKSIRPLCVVAFVVSASGCALEATKPAPPPVAVSASVSTTSANAVHWFRDSSEYEAAARTVYGAAQRHVESAAFPSQCSSPPAKPWAVVMDADETLLDNSLYQVEALLRGAQYNSTDWNEWVHRGEETLIPGAREFVTAVAQKCGVIVVVTNRKEKVNTTLAYDECLLTTDRLKVLFGASGKSPFAAVLCKVTDASGKSDDDKSARFNAIASGSVSGVGAVEVRMYVGDSITDFPDFKACNTAAVLKAASAKFGSEYFQLPNPMYGRWTGCAARKL
jgi:5'-nucleotidase (lipoprotein e(P4) family)